MEERTIKIKIDELLRVYNTLKVDCDFPDQTFCLGYENGIFDFLKHLLAYSGKITEPIFDDDLEDDEEERTSDLEALCDVILTKITDRITSEASYAVAKGFKEITDALEAEGRKRANDIKNGQPGADRNEGTPADRSRKGDHHGAGTLRD